MRRRVFLLAATGLIVLGLSGPAAAGAAPRAEKALVCGSGLTAQLIPGNISTLTNGVAIRMNITSWFRSRPCGLPFEVLSLGPAGNTVGTPGLIKACPGLMPPLTGIGQGGICVPFKGRVVTITPVSSGISSVSARMFHKGKLRGFDGTLESLCAPCVWVQGRAL